MTSLWLDRPDLPAYPPPPSGRRFDVVVVGAGLTGLTTALLLARSGCSVAVVEARHVGAGTTGNTTAKVTVLQGTKLSRIARRHSPSTVRDYVTGNIEGQQWLLRYCAEHDVPVQRRPAITYAATEQGRDAVGAEHDAVHEAGLPVEWLEDAGLPFETFGAVRLADQAQLDPLDVLTTLALDVEAHGGEIFTGRRVLGLDGTRPCRLRLADGEIVADQVVLATGTPVLDRGAFFARLEPSRSYAIALQVPGDIPRPMFISADAPTRSLRTAGADGDERLLVGGSGHPTGRALSEREHVMELTRWAADHFPGATPTHVWSAQDYRGMDQLPSVGPLVPGSDRVLVATGYDKWGMAMAVGAALTLSAIVLDGQIPWAHSLRTWRPSALTGLDQAVRFNAGVAARLAADWASPRVRSTGVAPPEGEGRVELDGQRPVAVSTVDGRTTRLSAACTHLGGIVSWNDAEHSWDCPLHGSRFTAGGEVLEGPATCALARLSRSGAPTAEPG
ncbi:FAD-dependent oxidoreductase [Georgenia subflava]|uniref:FAD-dependent oxidoreductase n=1 Tax=Georgenia subflava TaxID=1622177 RepID=A0A6N7EF27_9MICO|nr:FAD-dependent oxidoreductase [Georgenia subflava]MPV36630.1 FAD-dependent oxidoreductase [Georgenia subflava]